MQKDEWPSLYGKKELSPEERERWAKISKECEWGSDSLTGYYALCDKYKSSFNLGSYYLARAHVRAGLDACCSVLLTEDPKIINEYIQVIWGMLKKLDESNLEKLKDGESFHMLPVVSWYLYAYYFNNSK